MKKTLQIFAFAVIALAALASCAKEQFTENAIPAGEKIQVSINGQIGEFTSAEATKATAESVVRVTWGNGDKVYVYDGSASIDTLTVTPDDKNASYALLSGTITASAASPSKLTLVYVKGVESAPDIAEGKISIDLSAQNQKDVPFVLYSTIDYDAAKLEKSEECIPFSFATSVMTVNCTGLPTGAITKAEIDGVSTACELTVTGSGVTVAGASKGTITRSETAEPSVFTQSDSRGSFILALAADPAAPAARNILVYQDSKVYGAPFTMATLAGNKSYNTVYQLGEYVVLEGFVDLGLPSGLKWGVCNLGASNPWEYGKYFQWGDITGRICNGTTNGSTFEGGYNFQLSNAPFHIGTSNKSGWAKYIPTNISSYWSGEGTPDNKLVLNSEDDAASDANPDWRMPTKEDFQELYENTTSTWETDYNGTGISGRLFTSKKEGYTDKSVFFPAAGYPSGANLSNASSYGYYWSSSLYSSTPYSAYCLSFSGNSVNSQNRSARYSGFSVRPVTTTAPKPAVKVEGVSLASKDTVEVGATKTLVATVQPANATHKEVNWSSSDEAVATVDKNTGEVTGVAAGTAVITATTASGNFTAACIVTVTPALPSGALKGVFSVSATKKVRFSKGNLWYGKKEGESGSSLHFEDAQSSSSGSDGHVVLFNWSSTVEKAVGTSNDGNFLFCDENHKQSVDGSEPIWYALSIGEWWYLFGWNPELDEWYGDFDPASPRYNLYKFGVTVCGKSNCLVLAPDDFKGTIETSYDAAAWATAEAAGLVCLPSNVVGKGGYQSSSTHTYDENYYVFFDNSHVEVTGYADSYEGNSVRLVTDVE